MIQYKNISFSAKTFYGVKFEPGETKEVPGFINNPNMIRIFGKSQKVEVKPNMLFEAPTKVETRGRKKKSIEPEREPIAETKIELSKEETSDGN